MVERYRPLCIFDLIFPCLVDVFKVYLSWEIDSKTTFLALLFDLYLFNLLTKACFKLQCSSHEW